MALANAAWPAGMAPEATVSAQRHMTRRGKALPVGRAFLGCRTCSALCRLDDCAQLESSCQEDGHLSASDGVARTVIAGRGRAAAGDPVVEHVLGVQGVPLAIRDIREGPLV